MPTEALILEQHAEKRRNRRVLWSLLWLALALLLGTPLIWSWSVTRKWERLKAEYEASGETLDLAKLEPMKVPDEENVFGPDMEFDAGFSGEMEQDTFLISFSRNLSFQLENAALMSRSGFERAYSTVVYNDRILRLPSSTNFMPRELLTWIDDQMPRIEVLLTRLDRPYADHTGRSSPRMLDAAVFIRGAVGLFSDDDQAVTESLRLSIRNEEATGKWSISRFQGACKWLDLLWLTLKFQTLEQEQCQSILRDLHRIDMMNLCRQKTVADANHLVGLINKVGGRFVGDSGVPTIFIKRAAVEHLGLHLSTLRALSADRVENIYPGIEAYREGRDLRLLSRVFPDLSVERYFQDGGGHLRDVQSAVVLQTKIDLAKIALAAELYRFRHGDYPVSADSLVPEFLSSVPVDLMDGKPLRYARDGSRYRIWSIGRNGVDDGGKFFRVTLNSSGWTHPIHDGDWVWFYPKASE